MKSLLLGWLASVGALATLTLLPNVSTISYVSVLITATLVWLLIIVLWPIARLFLLPFNLATFGLASSIAYILLFWLCLWIVPGITVTPVLIYGWYLGDIAVLFLFSSLLSVLYNLYRRILSKLFREKARK